MYQAQSQQSNEHKGAPAFANDVDSSKPILDTILSMEVGNLEEWALLQQLAWLDPEFIPEELLLALIGNDQAKLWETIGNLEKFALVKATSKGDIRGVTIKPEIQDHVVNYAKDNPQVSKDIPQLLVSMLELLNNFFPEVTDKPDEKWDRARVYLPMVEALLGHSANRGMLIPENKDLALLNAKLGDFYDKVSIDAQKALSYKTRALTIYQTVHPDGKNHPDIAGSLNNLGLAYQKFGDNKKALAYLELALKMRETLYKGDHPDIVRSLYSLCAAYEKLGDVMKALDYKEQAIKIRQSLHKGDHPDIAQSLYSLGIAYQKLGDVKKALDYKEQALKMRQSLYKGDHPDVATSLHNVGVAYQSLEDNKSALDYYEQALKMRQFLYKGDHPDVAASLNAVGIVYGKLGDVKKGLIYFQDAKKMRLAIKNAAKKNQDLQEFKGKGTLGGHVDKCLEYYNGGIDQILKLRINALIADSKLKLLDAKYSTKVLDSATELLVNDVRLAFLGNAQIVLVPFNLNNKHWLGLLFKKLDHVVEVIYMDPEQRVMLPGLKSELETGLSMNGYDGSFLEARLEPQRYNNCGLEVIENFVYYLTGTRATQEGAIYVHSLLVENSLLDPREYGLKIEENNKLIGLLSNSAPLSIQSLDAFTSTESAIHPRSQSVVGSVAPLRSFRASAGQAANNDALIINLLPAIEQFNKLWAKWLQDKLRTVNTVAHQTTMSFKLLDFTIDSARLLHEPRIAHAKIVAIDGSYLYSMYSGVNGYSAIVGCLETAYQIHMGEYQRAFNVAASTMNAMALPYILTYSRMPYLSCLYGIYMAASVGYGAIINAYSFVLEIRSEFASLRSILAYKDLMKTLSDSPMQNLYPFAKAAKGYEIQANNLLCEKAKLYTQAQLEAEQGKFGRKLFDYIYKPMIEEQYTLANKIITGTVQEAEALQAKHIAITSQQQSYEHCMEIKNTFSNISSTVPEQYYCFNIAERVLDHIMITGDDSIEVIEHIGKSSNFHDANFYSL